MTRRHKHWGWGFEDQQPTPAQTRAAAAEFSSHLGLGTAEVEDPVPLSALGLCPPRVVAPAALADFCAADAHERASHALGKSYVDIVQGFRGVFDHPPDFVARPRDEAEVERVLEWCSAERVAAIPFGGGTSVVGGVRPEVPSWCNGVVSLDLRALERALEVDPVSRAARIQGGATGPALEAQLGEYAHVYPDGPAPYYTVLAQARRGEEADQWWSIKRAVAEAIVREGGTITHHHAVGRDHRPWYDAQRPEPFAVALRGAKAAVDPQGVMNPGVLVDPLPASGRESPSEASESPS